MSGIDTGAELRSLYSAEGGVREVFSSKVADYLASRPDYSAALFAYLREECEPPRISSSHGFRVISLERSCAKRPAP